MAQRPIVNEGNKYIHGLEMYYIDGGNVGIARGAARDSTNTVDIVLDTEVTANILASGVNGIDTGVVTTNTFYAVYLIGDSSRKNPSAVVLSESFSVTTGVAVLPDGYDVWRRVGAILTFEPIPATVNIRRFYQYGSSMDRTMYYDTAISVLIGGASTSFASINLSAAVIPRSSRVWISIVYRAALVANYVGFKPFGSPATEGLVRFTSGVAVNAQLTSLLVQTARDGEIPKVLYKVAAADTLDVAVSGYIDTLR